MFALRSEIGLHFIDQAGLQIAILLPHASDIYTWLGLFVFSLQYWGSRVLCMLSKCSTTELGVHV